jgi:hypothetical protein
VPSNRFNTRLSMAMPDRMLTALGKLNVPVYRLSRGRLLGKVGTAPVLLLTSTGRRSGQNELRGARCAVRAGRQGRGARGAVEERQPAL